jgi:hypothetical protein
MKWLLSYSIFMINVYFHARIVLNINFNTGMNNKQARSS